MFNWVDHYHSIYNEIEDDLHEVYQVFLLEDPSVSLYIGQGKAGKRLNHVFTSYSSCFELRNIPNKNLGVRVLFQNTKEIVIYVESQLLKHTSSLFNKQDGNEEIKHLDFLGKEFITFINEFITLFKSNKHLEIPIISFNKLDTVYFRLKSYPALELTLFSGNTSDKKLKVRGSKSDQKNFTKAFKSKLLIEDLLIEDLQTAQNINNLLYERIVKLLNN